MKVWRATAFAAVVVLSASSCSDDAVAADRRSKTLIITTTALLGDVVTELAGDDATVEVLIAGSQDPHTFSATPAQAARMRQADLVVAAGLGLEEGLSDVLAAASRDGVTVVEMGELADPLPLAAFSTKPQNGIGSSDPHFWFDPRRMAEAVDGLTEAITTIDPENATGWIQRAAGYTAELVRVDAEIRDLVATIPPEDRKLVTNHDSLRYFADRYEFEILGAVIPGGSTGSEPSAAGLAGLIGLLQETSVNALFAETTRPTRLAEVVAGEIDRDIVVVELFTGALGPAGSGAETYVGFLKTNATRIVQALAP